MTAPADQRREALVSPPRPAKHRRWTDTIKLFDVLPLIALIGLIVFFALSTDSFLSKGNLTLMGGQAGILIFYALGVTMLVVAGSIDLSIGSTVLLTGALVATYLTSRTASVLEAFVVSILVGAAVGLINGVLVVAGRVPSFIATLGSLSIFTGLGLMVSRGSSISFDNAALLSMSTSKPIPYLQAPLVLALVAVAVAWFIARRTKYGLFVYAIGGNEKVAVLSGIPVKRIRLFLFVITGATVAVGALLSMSQLQAMGPTFGSTAMIDAIAAIAVGGTALAGGTGGVERTMLGALILTVLSNGLNQMGVEDFTQTTVKGGVVIVAAVLTLAKHRSSVVK